MGPDVGGSGHEVAEDVSWWGMRTILLAVPLLSLAACNGGKACTEIGCSDGATVRFDGTLPDGTYTLEMADPGIQPSTCLFIVSGSDVDPAEDCELSVAWVDGAVEATVNGIAPDELVVALTGPDGSAVVDDVLNPSYETFQPNGEDCEPTCMQAFETVSVGSDA